MPQTPQERNDELLQEVATKSGLTKEQVLAQVPPLVQFAASLNPKALGGHLKMMLKNIPEGQGIPEGQAFQQQVLTQQLAKDWGSKGEQYAAVINKIPGAVQAASQLLGVDLSNPAVSGYDAQKQSLDPNVLAATILGCEKVPAPEEVMAIKDLAIAEGNIAPVALGGESADASAAVSDDSSAAAGRG